MLNIIDNLKIEHIFRGFSREFFSCDELILFKDAGIKTYDLVDRARAHPSFYVVVEYVNYYSIKLTTKEGFEAYVSRLVMEYRELSSMSENYDNYVEDHDNEAIKRAFKRNVYQKLHHINT